MDMVAILVTNIYICYQFTALNSKESPYEIWVQLA